MIKILKSGHGLTIAVLCIAVSACEPSQQSQMGASSAVEKTADVEKTAEKVVPSFPVFRAFCDDMSRYDVTDVPGLAYDTAEMHLEEAGVSDVDAASDYFFQAATAGALAVANQRTNNAANALIGGGSAQADPKFMGACMNKLREVNSW